MSLDALLNGARLGVFAATSPENLATALRAGAQNSSGGPARAAVLEPTSERLARAAAIAERGKPWRGREGIWFSPRGLVFDGGRLAFLFPGVDVTFEPRVDDVARLLSLPPPACTGPGALQEIGVGIIGVNRLLDRAIRRLGIEPHDVAGHSIGEWSGMISTGVIPDDAVDRFLDTLLPGSLEVPGVVFATAGCRVDVARAALEGLEEIALSHDNCPHQVLVCGVERSVDAALSRLRADGVVCQTLPFRSGFHSPLFRDYVGPHRENFERLPIRTARTTLWSATTCAPYPASPDEIRALAIEHLVRPVRFRELVDVLHAKGTRIFLQVGTGSLVHFVEDTLRGRPHVAIAANVPARTGLDQLRQVVAALFTEGASFDFGHDAASPESMRDSVLADFADSLAAIAEAEREVVARYVSVSKRPPRETAVTHEFSVRSMPELVDHALVRQPATWARLSDREPVVPMTTLVELMRTHAEALCPDRVAVELVDARAHRWLVVAPPVEAEVRCRRDGEDRIRVTIGDYCEGTVLFADRYPPAPALDDSALAGPARPAPDARALYDDHWLFHGPAFQGIVEVEPLGSDGIRGTLETGKALGSLLDNAGQLFGYWVMALHERDRMAMPVRIARIRWYGAHPSAGDRVACTVRVQSIDDKSVAADLTLAREGRVWAVVEGWENRRFETDERLWSVIQWPERSLLAEPQSPGFCLFRDRYRSGATRERIARRFLGELERSEYERKTPRGQRSWLAGRIAAKDAVRNLLWKLGHGPLFPIEVNIANEPSGRPTAHTADGVGVHVSIAHKEDIAVAIASTERSVGIDVERIEPRADSFAELSFTDTELRLVEGEPREEAWTRLWSAKEAAAKAAGTGLLGSPARFPIRDRAGERLLVGDAWVTTKRHGDFMIAWMGA